MKSVPKPCACTTVKKASRSLARVYDSALASAGLNVTQLAVLRAIERSPEESMAQVAEGLAMDRTSFYRSVDPLKREGWVQIVDQPSGPARSALVTPDGEDVLEAGAPLWEAMQVAIIDRFGRSAWRELVSELERLMTCLPPSHRDQP